MRGPDDTSGTAPAGPASDAAPVAPPVVRSIGERLRAGRERAGFSVPAAAEKLHLDPQVVEALEADRFNDMGASVYVRGHLKRYGDFVGENGAELVSLYANRDSRPPAPDLRKVPAPERRADPRRLLTPAVMLGSAVILLAAIWWVLVGSKSVKPAASELASAETQLAADAPDSELPVSDEPVMHAPGQGAALAATPVGLSNAAPVRETATPAAVEAQPPGVAAAAAVPAVKESAPREIQLRLELTNDSWVEVYDSSGQRLFYDVASGGSVKSVSGRGPLRVVLENAAGVSVAVDGQPREIPASAVDGERARFIVNRAGSLSRAR